MTRARNYGRLIPFILSKETIYSSCHDICFGSDKRGFLSFIFMFPLSNCQPFTLPFWSKSERGKMVQLSKWKKNNSQPSSFFYQLPSLLRQRKHLVPSVPPEKRGKKKGVRLYIPSANGDKEAASCHGPPDAGRLQVWMRGVLSGSHLDGEAGCCSLKWLCWHEVSCIVAYIRLAAALLPLPLASPVGLQGRSKRKTNESANAYYKVLFWRREIRPK